MKARMFVNVKYALLISTIVGIPALLLFVKPGLVETWRKQSPAVDATQAAPLSSRQERLDEFCQKYLVLCV